MKPLFVILSALVLNFASSCFGADDLASALSEVMKYESGASAEPLRRIERAVRESAGDKAKRSEVLTALCKLLADPATFEAKRFACTQLAIIGDDESLAAVVALLDKPESVGIACLALGSNLSPKVNETLRKALKESRGMAKVQIIVMLGDRGDEESVPVLSELTRVGDADAARAAIGSLGKIASKASLAQLEVLRKQTAPELAYTVAMASLVGADNAARRGDRAAAAAIYNQLTADSQPVNVRRAAFEGLLRTDEDGGEKRALEALVGTDSALTASAIAHARKVKSPGASEAFAKRISSLTAAGRVQMIDSLAVRNDPAARSAIAGQLTSSDPEVRRAAVLAFSLIGDEQSVPVLVAAFKAAAKPAEQQTIELALAGLKGGAAVNTAILSKLKNDGSAPKASLINAIARRGCVDAVPALLDEAGGSDVVVVNAAFRALGKLARPDDLPALLEKLGGLKIQAARGEAESAATKVLARVQPADLRFEPVSKAIFKFTDVDSRCSFIGLLPVCGDARALWAATEAKNSSEPRVREAAFRALSNWPDPSVIDTLLEMAQTAGQDNERALALRGTIRLLGQTSEYSAWEQALRYKRAVAAAKTVEEKKLVLGGLATVHDPMALDLIKPFTADPAVQTEAMHAAMSLAPYVCAISPVITRSILQTVMDQSVDKEIIQSARDLAQTMGKFEDFIMVWQVSEPFFQDGKDGRALFDLTFVPEQPVNSKVKWQLMPVGGRKDRPWMLDFGAFYGGDNRAAYARTWLFADAKQPVRLEFGSDDGLKVWLNGELAHAANKGGDVIPGDQKVSVILQQGSNELLLKVTQWTSGWGFCARATKPDGSPLQGVHVALKPSN